MSLDNNSGNVFKETSQNASAAKADNAREFSPRQRMMGVVMLVLCCSAVLFVWVGMFAEEQSPDGVIVRKKVLKRTDGNRICYDLCQIRQEKRKEHFGGNLLDNSDVLDILNKAKGDLVDKLRVDYGSDNFEKIFVKNGKYVGIEPITQDGDSVQRFKRKLQIKVLSMQSAILKDDSQVDGCDCASGGTPLVDTIGILSSDTFLVSKTYGKYVWATGGHSASAGHGNLYNESYTAYLERDAQPIFESIGIDFEGRNYAMGGTR